MFLLWMLVVVGSAAVILVLALVINCVVNEQSRVQVSPVNGVKAAPEEPNPKGSMASGDESKRASA